MAFCVVLVIIYCVPLVIRVIQLVLRLVLIILDLFGTLWLTGNYLGGIFLAATNIWK